MSARASAADGTLSRPAAALMCDIDFFKAVNDRHGHEFGDAALRSVAELLREFAAGRDAILGRQGGEEFVVLLFDAGLAEAAALARAIREACAARPIAWGGATASVTVSIGVAAAAAGTTTPPRLVSLADAALYDAKRGGRDRVALAA
jgi:diguanylate cyclase (GGDEF)-like protein